LDVELLPKSSKTYMLALCILHLCGRGFKIKKTLAKIFRVRFLCMLNALRIGFQSPSLCVCQPLDRFENLKRNIEKGSNIGACVFGSQVDLVTRGQWHKIVSRENLNYAKFAAI